MNHRTYDGQRYSPLARISRDNVKNLKLAYAVPLGGGAGNEFTNATPLAEDGFLYVHGFLERPLQDRRFRSGRCRAHRMARMIPSRIAKCVAAAQRCGGIPLVITGAGGFWQFAAHHRDRQGKRQGGVGDLVLGHTGR